MQLLEEVRRWRRSIYIVEISCQLLDVLLQLIRRLQAILKETAEQRDVWVSLTLTFSGINTRHISNLRELLCKCQASQAALLGCDEGHTERNWCSLCLMYRPTPSGTFASWHRKSWLAGSGGNLQRCLAHPEINYRSVSGAHLQCSAAAANHH